MYSCLLFSLRTGATPKHLQLSGEWSSEAFEYVLQYECMVFAQFRSCKRKIKVVLLNYYILHV